MVNAQYWLGLSSLAEAIGIEEKVIRFRIDSERNILIVEVMDPELPSISDGACAPIVGRVYLQEFLQADTADRTWMFGINRYPKEVI